MPFTIPSNDLAFSPHQSHWYDTDIAIAVAAIGGTGVLTGCGVTAQGTPDMTVAVAAGTIQPSAGAAAITVTAGNLAVSAAHATLNRMDLISASAAGVKTITAGTAATNPKPPDLPSGHVGLAMILVPPTVTVIATNKITDKRCTVFASTSGGGGGGGTVNGGWVLLGSKNAAGLTAIDFIGSISALYDEYVLELDHLLAGTAAPLNLIVSTDGGSTWDTASGHYTTSHLVWSSAGSAVGSGAGASVALYPYAGRNCATTLPVSGSVTIYNPLATAKQVMIGAFAGGDSVTSDATQTLEVTGSYNQLAAFNAIRLALSGSPAFTSGMVRLYGKSKTAAASLGTAVYSNAIPVMTGASAPSGVASDSEHFSASDGWHAMTGVDAGWLTNGSALPQWIKYQFPAAKTVVAYSFRPWFVDNYPSRTPTAWKLQGSNDNSAWTDLDTVTGFSPSSSGADYVFTVDSPQSFLYYRLNVTANGGNAYTGVGRFALFASDSAVSGVLVVTPTNATIAVSV